VIVKHKTIDLDHVGGYQIQELVMWMLENEIPLRARMQYAGCGSHVMEFEWSEKTDEDRMAEALENL
jgi:hypothetical protein